VRLFLCFAGVLVSCVLLGFKGSGGSVGTSDDGEDVQLAEK
jgi:hypothetical protein